MSLRRELKTRITSAQPEDVMITLPLELMKRIRLELVNDPRDDEEGEMLLERFSSREQSVSIERHTIVHLIDYLSGES